MKKVALAILTLLGFWGGQVAQAWEWPFFGSKNEAPPEPAPLSALPNANSKGDLSFSSNDFLSENRLKFVARSYAQSFDLKGVPTQFEFDGRLLSSRGEAQGFVFQPTDYARFYGEALSLRQTPTGPWADRLDDLDGLTVGVETGVALKFEGFTADLKYFDYRTQARPPTPLDLALNGPEEAARVKGLEFSAAWAMDQTFNWDFELRPYVSLVRLLDETTPRSLWERPDQDLRVSYGLTFSHEKLGFAFSVEANDRGRRASWPTRLVSDDYLDSMVYDFHLVKRLYDWQDQGRLLLKADVTNIGDAQASNNLRGKNEEGRTFKTGLRYEY